MWQAPKRGRRDSWAGSTLALTVLALVVLAAHGGSLDDGLFFDDHWHRATLRQSGWSFNELVETATFDLPGPLVHLWWQERPMQWRYARPVAMFFMKLELLLTGGNPVAIHACGLLWHVVTSFLVYRLGLWALRTRGWALFAAALFALNPHAVFAVSWIAARNALVSTFFFVAALLLYATSSFGALEHPPHRAALRFAGAGILWLLALFSREAAIVFPAVVLMLDLFLGGRQQLRRRLAVHVVLWLAAAAYLYWRLEIFPTRSVPDIYFTAPSGLAYVPWAASKLLHMLFAIVFYTPMFLGLATYASGPGAHAVVQLVIALLLALIALAYAVGTRRQPGRWFWPTFLVAALLPVVPVFIMPHFAYLPFVAYAIMAASVFSRLTGAWRTVVPALVLAATLWTVGVYRYVWRGVVRSEQLIYADLRAAAAPPPAGSTLFFFNLPLTGIYATVAMREAWGVPELEGHVLTFAPHPLVMDQPCRIRRLSDRELLVSTPAPGFFAGLTGRMLLDGMRPNSPLVAGRVVHGDPFDVTVLEADYAGVRQLKFTFHRPLDTPGYCFFVTSADSTTNRLRFDVASLQAEQEPAGPPSPTRVAWLAERRAYFTIVNTARRLVRSDLFLTGDPDTR